MNTLNVLLALSLQLLVRYELQALMVRLPWPTLFFLWMILDKTL